MSKNRVKNTPTSKQPKVPYKIIKEYQEMPIFSGCNLYHDEALAMAMLAKKLKEKSPYISADVILLNQLELYIAIQNKVKELPDLRSKDEAKKRNARKILATFRNNFVAKSVQNPNQYYLGYTIPNFLDCIQDISLKTPKKLDQKKYKKLINEAVTEHKLKKHQIEDTDFLYIYHADCPNFTKNSTPKNYTKFILNINLETPEVFDKLANFAQKYKTYFEINQQLKNNYIDLKNVLIFADSSDASFDEQLQELQSIAKQYCRTSVDDKIIGKKVSDGLFIEYDNQPTGDLEKLITAAKSINVRSPMASYLESIKNKLQEDKEDTLDADICVMYARFIKSTGIISRLFEKQDNKREQDAFNFVKKNSQVTITELSSEELDARSKQEDKKEEEEPQVTNSEDSASALAPANPADQAQSSQPAAQAQSPANPAAQAQSPASAASSQQTAQPASPASPNSAPISPEDTSTTEEDDDDYKAYWRKYANSVADKLGGKMEEDTSASTFEAKVTTDNDTTYISASSKSNVSLGAQKKNGTPTVPDLKVFMALAEKAAKEDSIINFGNIRDNEFKARLLIACKEKKVKTQRAPAINEEFLNSLDSASKSRLSALLNKEQYQETPSSSAIEPTTDNEKPVKQQTSAETKATRSAVASRIQTAKEATH